MTFTDITERIIDYEAQEGVHFPIKKLFILVPDSMFTANTLDGENLEKRRNLEAINCNRSGIQKRTYHNSVYKITNTDWYVTVEGASPLQTYYEAMRSEPRLKLFRKEIAIAFYNTLKHALWKERQTRDLCEVIHIKGEFVLFSGYLTNKIMYELNAHLQITMRMLSRTTD